MNTIMEIYAYIIANWYGILIAGSSMLTTAQLIVRLTPTKSDDGFVQRMANFYDKIFDLLKVPNIKTEEGKIIIPNGTHPPKNKKLTLTAAEKK